MNRRILQLAVPNIISNITVPLLGMVDLGLMGHLGSDDYIGAIALGTMIFNFIYWGFAFLRMGTSGFTAQEYGRRDLSESIHIFARALLIALGSGAFLLLFQWPLKELAFTLISAETRVELLANEYFRMRIWAAPATLSLYVFYGWYIGMQNARLPMIIAITVNIVNILANVFFVKVLHMDVRGVALGTVIAQYSGLALAAFFLLRYYRKLLVRLLRERILNTARMVAFMRVNSEIFIRTFCLVLVFTFFTARSAAADVGDDTEKILAVNTLLMQFFMFFSYLIDGFAYAAEALTGKYVGARSPAYLRRVIRLLFIWGLGIGLGFTLIYGLGKEGILGLLTNNVAVKEAARPYFIWITLVPLISFSAFLLDGIFIGATAGKEMRNAMLISTFVFFFLPFYLLRGSLGNHALWLAFSLFMIARSGTMALWLNRAVYRKALPAQA